MPLRSAFRKSLRTDCLKQLGDRQWAIHVPLGKLHTERRVPADDDLRHVVARIMALRGSACNRPAASPDWLLIKPDGRRVSYADLHGFLKQSARLAGCSAPVRPHQLRHTYASTMLRAGVSLPAVKELLGHKDIRMAMVYILVTQVDLQQQYHRARGKMDGAYNLPLIPQSSAVPAGIPAIDGSLAAVNHLLEMYRRQLEGDKSRLKITRLINRVAKIRDDLAQLAGQQKGAKIGRSTSLFFQEA